MRAEWSKKDSLHTYHGSWGMAVPMAHLSPRKIRMSRFAAFETLNRPLTYGVTPILPIRPIEAVIVHVDHSDPSNPSDKVEI